MDDSSPLGWERKFAVPSLGAVLGVLIGLNTCVLVRSEYAFLWVIGSGLVLALLARGVGRVYRGRKPHWIVGVLATLILAIAVPTLTGWLSSRVTATNSHTTNVPVGMADSIEISDSGVAVAKDSEAATPDSTRFVAQGPSAAGSLASDRGEPAEDGRPHDTVPGDNSPQVGVEPPEFNQPEASRSTSDPTLTHPVGVLPQKWSDVFGLELRLHRAAAVSDACPTPFARANWEDGFRAIPVECSGDWIVVDAAKLLKLGKVRVGGYYCIRIENSHGQFADMTKLAGYHMSRTYYGKGKAIGLRVNREDVVITVDNSHRTPENPACSNMI